MQLEHARPAPHSGAQEEGGFLSLSRCVYSGDVIVANVLST